MLKKGFFNLEVNEIKEKIVGVSEAFEKNCWKGSVGFAKGDNVVCKNQCHVVLELTCKNQDFYSNNGKFVVVTKQARKNDAVSQED